MSTTLLRLPEELKQRAAKAAQALGISPDEFMIEAIRRAADAVEQRSRFVAEAVAARDEMRETGLGRDADDVRAYLRKRIDDKQALRSDAKSWRE